MTSLPQRVTCCIAGGGPAGVMLGFLLARAGVGTVVLEKHKDFFRDFRGDTIHPSTLQIMHELGLLDAFLKLPHQEVRALRAKIGNTEIQLADFSHLPTVCKYIALMPQWIPQFPCRAGAPIPGFRSAFGNRSDRSDRRGRPGHRLRAKARAARSRSAPTWSSAPTAANRPCASEPASR